MSARVILGFFGALFVSLFFMVGTVSAAGVGGELHTLADVTGQDSVGEFISSLIYGNTSNPSGNGNGVLPSLSPGPWRCGNPADCAGPTAPGGSMGEFIAPTTSDGSGTPDFANSKTPGPDFSN